MKPLVYRSWRGKIFGLDAEIQISCEEDPPVIAEDIRTSFRGVVANVGNFTKRVARRELDLAKQWAQEGELDLVLDELSFADLLKIKAFSIDPGRLTVWLQEAANIFAGHDLEVRIEDGVIAEICLAG